jgi:hypothetical protein
MEPRPRSATERRDLRREARYALGNTREDAPRAPQVVRAAALLGRLVSLATDGRLRLALVDTQTGEDVSEARAQEIVSAER